MSLTFNEEQLKAVLKLEEALKEVYDSGLRIQGMDTDLELYRQEDYEQINKKFNDSYRTLSQLQREILLYIVDSNGAYVDSGGW